MTQYPEDDDQEPQMQWVEDLIVQLFSALRGIIRTFIREVSAVFSRNTPRGRD